MAATSPIPMLLACLLGVCLSVAQAHGGGLHRWTLDPEVLKVVKTAAMRPQYITGPGNGLVGISTTWAPLNFTAVSPGSYSLPFFTPTTNITISGTVGIHSYLSNNCSNSIQTGLFPFLKLEEWKTKTVKRNGKRTKVWFSKPAHTGYTTFGYAFTGPCSAPGSLYRNNAALQDNRFNLAWWGYEGYIGVGNNMTDLYRGYLWGAAPQSWLLRNLSDTPIASIVVVVQAGPTFCTNVKYAGFPAPSEVMKLGDTSAACTAGISSN